MLLSQETIIRSLQLFLLLDLLHKIATYTVCQVEKQPEYLAEVVSSHHRKFAIHVGVIIENIQQITQLNEGFVVAKHWAAPEGLHYLLNSVFCVSSIYVCLNLHGD